MSRVVDRFLSALRMAFGLLFVVASLDKIAHPQAFAVVVQNYQILPLSLVNAVAILLPWTEMVCGLALILNVLPRGAAVILSAMTVAFIVVLAYNLSRGLDVNCGCFSVEGGETMSGALVRDVVLVLAAIMVLWHVFWRPGRPEEA